MTRAERRQQQIDRVDAYYDWLHARGPLTAIPPVPRNCDFKVWREARGVRAARMALDQTVEAGNARMATLLDALDPSGFHQAAT